MLAETHANAFAQNPGQEMFAGGSVLRASIPVLRSVIV